MRRPGTARAGGRDRRAPNRVEIPAADLWCHRHWRDNPAIRQAPMTLAFSGGSARVAIYDIPGRTMGENVCKLCTCPAVAPT